IAGGRPCVALCPGARHATKCWPEPSWCELGSRLAADGFALAVLSTPAEQRGLPRLAAQVGAAGACRWFTESLERAAALLGECALAVTQDSGLMHLAVARGLRVV